MGLQRWDPFAELRRMDQTIDRLWRGFGSTGSAEGGLERWGVPLDVVQEGDNIIIHASLPGVGPESIQVTIEDDVLTIRGETASERETKEGSYLMRERRSGSFHRSLRLPDSVDTEKAESSYEHGVLSITFPKQEAKKAKRIEVGIKS